MAKQSEATLLIRIKEAGQFVLDRLVFTFGDLANIIKNIGSTLVNFTKESVAAYHEQELAINRLNQSLVQQGIFTKELSESYIKLAESLEKTTTFSDDAIISAQSTMQAYLGETVITKELLKATLDLAAGKRIDLASASELVGRTIGTANNALSKSGVVLDENLTKSERLAAVIRQLNGQWGGQAEAAAKGLGVMAQLGNAYNNLQEKIGGVLAPLIRIVSNHFISLFGGLEKNNLLFQGLSTILAQLYTPFGIIIALIQNTITVISALGDAIQITSLIMQRRFIDAAKLMGQSFKENLNIMINDWKKFDEDLTRIANSANIAMEEKRALDEQKTRDSEARKKQIAIDEARAKDETLKAQRDIAAQQEKDKETESAEALRQLRLTNKFTELEDNLLHSENKAIADELNAQREVAITQQIAANKKRIQDEENKREEEERSKKIRAQQGFYSQIATLQSSHNKALLVAGKAAAIANIWISTSEAVAKVPSYFPWPFSAGVQALLFAAGAAQAANVAGVHLAEGGIVQATPGGIQATIGEGGQDEAVIPLDEGAANLGNKINITVNGGLLGDADTARQFALAIDQELLKLRKNNESRSFDSGVL